MKSVDVRQGALGVLAALISMVMVVGSLALSIAEGGLRVALAPEVSATLSPIQTQPVGTYSNQAATSMVTPIFSLTPMPTPSFTPSPTPPPPPSSCPPPDGWIAVTVQIGDTLYSLAQTYNVSEKLLAKANCLVTKQLMAGTILYVPALPTPLPPVVCGPPAGWVIYIVQPGDTLYGLSLIYRVSVYQLQLANCLGTSTYIRAGQRLYVPFYIYPTLTRTPVPLPTSTFTLIPTSTATGTVTYTPTLPVGFTPAVTATSTPTATLTFTPTPTATDTFTPTPTATETFTATPTPTLTFTPTATVTPSPTVTLSPTTTTITILPGFSPSP